MRILICGGRDFDNLGLFNKAMQDVVNTFGLNPREPFGSNHVIIEGGAKGADRMAGTFAEVHGWGLEVYPADWERYGKSAGPIRNKQMLEEGKPDLVIAFPGGRGTANMKRLAEKAGVSLWEYSMG